MSCFILQLDDQLSTKQLWIDKHPAVRPLLPTDGKFCLGAIFTAIFQNCDDKKDTFLKQLKSSTLNGAKKTVQSFVLLLFNTITAI